MLTVLRSHDTHDGPLEGLIVLGTQRTSTSKTSILEQVEDLGIHSGTKWNISVSDPIFYFAMKLLAQQLDPLKGHPTRLHGDLGHIIV